jgi:hypothetical protein
MPFARLLIVWFVAFVAISAMLTMFPLAFIRGVCRLGPDARHNVRGPRAKGCRRGAVSTARWLSPVPVPPSRTAPQGEAALLSSTKAPRVAGWQGSSDAGECCEIDRTARLSVGYSWQFSSSGSATRRCELGNRIAWSRMTPDPPRSANLEPASRGVLLRCSVWFSGPSRRGKKPPMRPGDRECPR